MVLPQTPEKQALRRFAQKITVIPKRFQDEQGRLSKFRVMEILEEYTK